MQEEQIREFFEGAKKLVTEDELDKKDLDHFFSDLGFKLEIYQRAKKDMDIYLASDFNVFSAYIKPDENRMSDIIKDLLDSSGNHGQGDIFLKEFLKIIGKFENYNIQKLTLIREDSTTYITKSQRRIDITLDFDGQFAIGIENKPWAVEQEDQLKDYKEHLEKKYLDNYFLIYLSGNGSLPASIGSDIRESLEREKKFKVLSYPFELKNWLESCYKECRSDKIRWFLRDFIKYVEKSFRIHLVE